MIGVVHDHDIAGTGRPLPGISDEALGGGIARPGLPRLQERPGTVAERIICLQHRQEPRIEGRDLRIRGLDRPAAQMRGQAHPGTLGLALLEEAKARGEEGDDGGGLVLGPGEGGRSPRLVMVLQKAGQLVLIVEAGEEMTPDLRRIGMAQPVIEPLVVAIVEALVLQRPFEVPIDLRHESEAGVGLADRGDRLGPERLRRQAPGAVEHLGQQQHRHVAAQPIAMLGNRRQLRHLGRLQHRIGIVELQRIRPAGEIRIAAMSQDPRSLIRLGPPVIAGGGRQIGLVALDIEIRLGPDPGRIEARVVGHEIEHQLDAALGEAGAEARERRRPAQIFIDLVIGDGEARSRDIGLGKIGQGRLAFGAPRGRALARHRPALRADLPDAQQPDPVEAVARETIEDVLPDIGEGDLLPGIGRQPIQPGAGVDLEQRGVAWHGQSPLTIPGHGAQRSYWRPARSSPSDATRRARVHCRRRNIRGTGCSP